MLESFPALLVQDCEVAQQFALAAAEDDSEVCECDIASLDTSLSNLAILDEL